MIKYHTFHVSYEDDSSHFEFTFTYLSEARSFFDFLLAKASLLNLNNVSLREEVDLK